MPTGTFLALDGLDGTGKSTQRDRLLQRLALHQIPVTSCIDPGGTELGTRLREILLFGRQHQIALRTEALLFMASRAQLVDEIIRPALTAGQVVVSDRYLLANVVYQGYAGGLSPDELWQAGRLSTGGIMPDLTLVFDLPVADARARRGRTSDRMESRGAEYDERVRQGFLTEAKRQPDAIRIIDAQADVDTIHETVWSTVAPLLSSRGWDLSEE